MITYIAGDNFQAAAQALHCLAPLNDTFHSLSSCNCFAELRCAALLVYHRNVHDITLSYTFFKTDAEDDQEDGAVLPLGSGIKLHGPGTWPSGVVAVRTPAVAAAGLQGPGAVDAPQAPLAAAAGSREPAAVEALQARLPAAAEAGSEAK